MKASDICTVAFTEGQYDDVGLAFDSERLVTVVIYETVQPHELISITFNSSQRASSENNGAPSA